ncbi:MAG: hypothetical protein P8Y61_09855 [Gammaproteobacteria bacterium]
MSHDLHFSILGVPFTLENATGRFRELTQQNYSAYLTEASAKPAFFSLGRQSDGRLELKSLHSGVIWAGGVNAAEDDYHFLYALEKELTLELQRARSELYFVHAAVVERNGHCLLIAAESGTGKSTLAFALQCRGWHYLSDELAPIDVTQLSVYPYTHALCLKSAPPEPFASLPPHVNTDRTRHVPADQLNSVTDEVPRPLSGLVFLQRNPGNRTPSIKKISAAEAATRLYGNTLNALAHSAAGLDAATTITRRTPAWHLEAGELRATCELMEEALV